MADIRPTRNVIVTLGAFLFAISFGAARDFVWADLRGGAVRTKGLPAPVRTIVWIGFGVLAAMVGVLLFGDALRRSTDLEAAANGTVGRGTLVPTALVPASMFVLALGVALLITGSLHLRWPFRVGALLIQISLTSGFAFATRDTTGETGFLDVLVPVSFGLSLAFCVFRWFRPPRPVFEFLVLFGLNAACLSAAQILLRRIDTDLGTTNFALTSVNQQMLDLATLALPMLFLLGFDLAELGERGAAWTSQLVFGRLGRIVPYLALAALAAWRLKVIIGGVADQVDIDGSGTVLGTLAGALVLVIALGVLWWWLGSSRAGRDPIQYEGFGETARKVGVPAVALYFLPLVAVTIWIGLHTGAFLLRVPGVDLFRVNDAVDGVQFLIEQSDWIRGGIAALALLTAPVVARRIGRAPAFFLAAVGVVYLHAEAVAPRRPFDALGGDVELGTDVWVTLVILAVAAVLLVRRRLDVARALDIFFALVIAEALRHSSLLEDPFTAVLGFGGFFVIVFGLVFDLLTVGAWANEDEPRSPRAGRLLTYLGYVLCSITIVTWSVVSHDLAASATFTGSAALVGFEVVGRPLLLGAIFLALAEAWRGEPVVEVEGVEPPAPIVF